MKKITAIFLSILLLLALTACGEDIQPTANEPNTTISAALQYDHSMDRLYAEQFAVDYYNDGYALLTISNGSRFLVIPEGKSAPNDLPNDIVPLQQPINNVYLAASATMDFFVSLDALDSVRFSALKADSWYIPSAKKAMETDRILYAGKYAAPDYEMILAEGCDLAIENTMIYHTPEVKEQLERVGVPVLVDYSSYESHPLARTEWIKVYGLLTDKEQAAETAFQQQVSAFQAVSEKAGTGKTVAFFYITSNGEVSVRRTSDYVPKMIELAGGHYLFDDLGSADGSAASTVTMQMEEFYARAKDADVLIYNSTIDGELPDLDAFLQKSDLLQNCKAVQTGSVYCTTKNLYQSTMALGTFTADLYHLLTGDDSQLTYLYKLE